MKLSTSYTEFVVTAGYLSRSLEKLRGLLELHRGEDGRPEDVSSGIARASISYRGNGRISSIN